MADAGSDKRGVGGGVSHRAPRGAAILMSCALAPQPCPEVYQPTAGASGSSNLTAVPGGGPEKDVLPEKVAAPEPAAPGSLVVIL